MPDCPYCGEHPYEHYCESYRSHVRCCKKSNDRSDNLHREDLKRRDATIAEQHEIIARHEKKIEDLTTQLVKRPIGSYCESYRSHVHKCKKSKERSDGHYRHVLNRRATTIAAQREMIAHHEEKIDDLTTEVEDLRSQVEEREFRLATANSTIDQLRRRSKKTILVPVIFQPTDFLSWPYRKISIANVIPQKPNSAVVPFRTLQNSSHLVPFRPQNHRVI